MLHNLYKRVLPAVLISNMSETFDLILVRFIFENGEDRRSAFIVLL